MHLLHLLGELLHLFRGLLLTVGGFFVFAFVQLLRPLLHFLLNGLLFLRAVHHGIGVFKLLVVFLKLVQILAQFVKSLVEAVLFGLEFFGIHQAQIRFLREPFLLLCQLFQVFDGLVHFGFPLQLPELFQSPVELLFHGVVVELHLVELLLHFLRVHFLHELFHLLVNLPQLFAHDVVHEFLKLVLLVENALLLLAEFVGAFVFALIVLAHLLELLLKRLLLLHQVLHGLAILPRHFTLFTEALLHGLHGFPQLRRLPRCLFQVFFNGLSCVVALFADFFLARSGNAGGSGPHHFGAVDAVVVPNLKPALQHIALLPIEVAHVPRVEEGALTS